MEAPVAHVQHGAAGGCVAEQPVHAHAQRQRAVKQPHGCQHALAGRLQQQAGERLAVIEAMKMENILSASQDVTVAEVLAKPGESLSVDQPILRFA